METRTSLGRAFNSPHAINFSWLVRLRWGAVAGQVATIAIATTLFDLPVALGTLAVIVALEALTNVGAMIAQQKRKEISEASLVFLLLLDIVFLTLLLSFSGGPSNPFNFLYLVYIALAAVVLRSGWTWALLSFSVIASGTLFLWNPADSTMGADAMSGHSLHMRLHMEGMWVAFAVAAAFIVYFVTRVRRALAQREADLEAERRLVAVNEKLAALATLAAGAAHELATPLGTIAVVAREMERRPRADQEDRDDIILIREQVERCRKILDGMATDAGAGAGEGLSQATLASLLTEALAGVAPSPAVRLETGPTTGTMTIPLGTLAQAIRGVVRNAQEASVASADVLLRGSLINCELCIEIEDHGSGMTSEVLRRIGEPFFTTKAPGRGMGLGLFLTRTITERLGGKFDVSSKPGEGTLVTIRVPADVRSHVQGGAPRAAPAEVRR